MTWKPDYETLANVKAYLRVTDTVDDVELALWITAASRAIDRRTKRQFGNAGSTVTRTYRRPAYYDPDLGLYCVEIDDVYDATGLTVGGVAYASSGAVLLPDNALLDGVPYERLGFTSQPLCPTAGSPASLAVASPNLGWASVPKQVPAALRLQVNRWAFRRDAPAGVAGSPDQGSEVRLLAKLDPDLATSLIGLSRRQRAA